MTADACQKLLVPDAYARNDDFVLHLLLHSQGYFLQGQFTELEDVLGPEEVGQCRLHLLRAINLAGFQTGYQFFGSQVDVHHLVRFLKDTVGDALFDFDAGDALHFFVHALDVLDVDGGNHVDAFVQKVHHVLPTLFVTTAFYVGMRQFVHDDYFGMDADDTLQIHFFQFLAFVEYPAAGDDGQACKESFRPGTSVGFDVADLHVYAVVQQVVGFLEHPVRLAHTGYHADVNLELATTGFLYQVEEVLHVLFSVHTFK